MYLCGILLTKNRLRITIKIQLKLNSETLTPCRIVLIVSQTRLTVTRSKFKFVTPVNDRTRVQILRSARARKRPARVFLYFSSLRAFISAFMGIGAMRNPLRELSACGNPLSEYFVGTSDTCSADLLVGVNFGTRLYDSHDFFFFFSFARGDRAYSFYRQLRDARSHCVFHNFLFSRIIVYTFIAVRRSLVRRKYCQLLHSPQSVLNFKKYRYICRQNFSLSPLCYCSSDRA